MNDEELVDVAVVYLEEQSLLQEHCKCKFSMREK